MTRREAISFARGQLAEGVDAIDIVADLEVRGFTPREAEEIVDVATFDERSGEARS